MRLQVVVVAAFMAACGPGPMSASDAGSAGGGSAAGASGGGAAGGSAGGAGGGGTAGGSTVPSDAGVSVCAPERPTTSCDDEGGPLNGVSGLKGTCLGGGAACQCTAPYVVNPVTGRCRAVPDRQPVCQRYDGIQCQAVLADGGTRPATGTCGTMTIPSGCGCVHDWRTNTYRAACDQTCLKTTLPGDQDCFTLNCGTIACLDDTRCMGPNTCR